MSCRTLTSDGVTRLAVRAQSSPPSSALAWAPSRMSLGDNESSPGRNLEESFGLELQQALANRGGTDAERVGHGFGPDELAPFELPGDDQVADVGGGFIAETQAPREIVPGRCAESWSNHTVNRS